MTITTNLKFWDVVFTTYLSILVTPVFLIAWIAFSILFTYQSNYFHYVEDELMIFVLGFIGIIYYFISIQVFMFIFNFIVCLVNPKLRKGILGQHKFEITDEGLIEETDFNKAVHKWPSIDRVIKIFGYIMVRVAGNQWHVFPKKTFENEDKKNEFISTLRSKIKA